MKGDCHKAKLLRRFWAMCDVKRAHQEGLDALDALDEAGRGLEIDHNQTHKYCHLSQNLETFVQITSPLSILYSQDDNITSDAPTRDMKRTYIYM